MNAARRPPKPDDVSPRRVADGAGAAAQQAYPLPDEALGEAMVRRAYGEPVLFGEGAMVVGFQPHLRKMFASWSEDDVARLGKLMSLRPETVAWIEGKNTRELQQLDGAVEFITSSRTAARVLMWVGGAAVAFVGGVAALAKNGIDLFSLLRGGR